MCFYTFYIWFMWLFIVICFFQVQPFIDMVYLHVVNPISNKPYVVGSEANAQEINELGYPKLNVTQVGCWDIFITKQMFTLNDHGIRWVRVEAVKLGLSVVIESVNLNLIEEKLMDCEIGGEYK